jgi:hypothetical protein
MSTQRTGTSFAGLASGPPAYRPLLMRFGFHRPLMLRIQCVAGKRPWSLVPGPAGEPVPVHEHSLQRARGNDRVLVIR